MLAVDGLWLWQEKEGSARAPRPDRERRHTDKAEAAGDLERTEEGNRDVTKPKQWTGREPAKKTPAKKKTPKAAEKSVEPIPDEAEVLDEQTTLGST